MNKRRNIHFTDWNHQIILFIVGVLNIEHSTFNEAVPGPQQPIVYCMWYDCLFDFNIKFGFVIFKLNAFYCLNRNDAFNFYLLHAKLFFFPFLILYLLFFSLHRSLALFFLSQLDTVSVSISYLEAKLCSKFNFVWRVDAMVCHIM